MGLKRQALKGTVWTSSSLAVQVVVSTLRLSILTRFLAPADFGLVAIVVMVLGFTHIFTDLGVSASLFSKDKINIREYSSLYWVSLLLGFFLYGLLCASAPLITSFYRMSELKNLIPLLGLDLIIATAGRQFKVFKQKELRFRHIALIEISANLTSLVLAVYLAMNGYGVYSLIYSRLSASVLTSFLLILTSLKTHPLILHVNYRESKGFYRIGIFQTGAQILDYIASQMDIIIIGKLMDVSDLGIYNLVKQLIMRVYSFVNPVISTVSVPLLLKIKEDIQQFKERYLQMLGMVSFANTVFYGILAVSSYEVIKILYGVNYVSATPILSILCIWGAVTSISGGASSIIVIFGRTDIGFKWTLIRILLDPLFVIIGFKTAGMVGIVIAQSIFSVIMFFMYKRIVINNILPIINLKEYLKHPIAYICTALSIATGVIASKHYLNLYQNSIALIVAMIIGIICFISLFIICNYQSSLHFVKFIIKKGNSRV